MKPLPVRLDDVAAAAGALAGGVARTPAIAADALSRRLGCRLVLKLETQQPTGSFKVRGALNKLLSLDPDQRARGVVAASAGNHSQGVAYHAARLDIPATIVMPLPTPFTKVARTEALGAKVEQVGETLSEAQAHADHLRDDLGLTMVHPYDDPLIVAGQGTIGLEMADILDDLDDLVVPIGGGGLISGIAIAARSRRPDLRIIGVQSTLYCAMRDAIAGGGAANYGGPTIADGIAVKRPGAVTRQIIDALVDDIVTVDETALEQAVQLLVTEQKLVAEGAGAAGIAGILSARGRFADRRVATVLCGGNIDPRLLATILMRGLARDGQLVRFAVAVEDRPGELSRVTRLIGDAGGNIVEIHHNRLMVDVPVKRTDLEVIVDTRDAAHAWEIQTALRDAGVSASALPVETI